MIDKQRWAIPEGYIPEESTGPEPEMERHETIYISVRDNLLVITSFNPVEQ